MLAVVRPDRVHAREDLDERALAGAVRARAGRRWSRRRASRSTSSTARMPGNRFVSPVARRTGTPAVPLSRDRRVPGPVRPSPSTLPATPWSGSAGGLLVRRVLVDVVDRVPPGGGAAHELADVGRRDQVDRRLGERDLARRRCRSSWSPRDGLAVRQLDRDLGAAPWPSRQAPARRSRTWRPSTMACAAGNSTSWPVTRIVPGSMPAASMALQDAHRHPVVRRRGRRPRRCRSSVSVFSASACAGSVFQPGVK